MTRLDVLKDVLEDFLELKALLSGRKTQPIKRFLLSQSLEKLEILPLEGFRLDRNLILLENGSSNPIENLIFLMPRTGTIQIKGIKEK